MAKDLIRNEENSLDKVAPAGETDLASWLSPHLISLSQLPGPLQIDRANPRHLRTAGVLVPIVDRPAGPTVLLTLRSPALRAHAGQISFPGGGIEVNDRNVVETALRETREETGIDASFITPIGGVEPVESATGFLLFPTVAVLREGFSTIANPGEVDTIFEVPFAFLMDRTNHVHKSMTIAGATRDFYSIVYGPYDIWGATARVLVNLSQRLSGQLAASGHIPPFLARN